jgi:hypothetical protein
MVGEEEEVDRRGATWNGPVDIWGVGTNMPSMVPRLATSTCGSGGSPLEEPPCSDASCCAVSCCDAKPDPLGLMPDAGVCWGEEAAAEEMSAPGAAAAAAAIIAAMYCAAMPPSPLSI